jgi:transposase
VTTAKEALAARIEKNRRGNPTSDEKARELLAEYIADGKPTSYRKLAKKHGMGVSTVQRAILRAAHELTPGGR